MTNGVPGSRKSLYLVRLRCFLGGSLIVMKGRGITVVFEIGVSEVSVEEEEVEMFKGGEA